MSYTHDNQKIDDITVTLKDNLKEFRIIAENMMMDTSEWNLTYRLKLKDLSNKMLDIQLELNELV